MHARSTPSRGMPLVVSALIAVASLATLLALPGGAWEKEPDRTAPTASLTRADRIGLASASHSSLTRPLSPGSSRPVRMPSP